MIRACGFAPTGGREAVLWDSAVLRDRKTGTIFDHYAGIAVSYGLIR